MKKLLFVLFLILPPMPLAQADSHEEDFTLKFEHYEIPQSRHFNAASFRGRAWDLEGVLKNARFPLGLQVIHSGPDRAGPAQGKTFCVRVPALPSSESGRQLAIAPEQREQTLNNLLTQLRQRVPEMKDAGAYYRVEYPSRCAIDSPRQVAKLGHGAGH